MLQNIIPFFHAAFSPLPPTTTEHLSVLKILYHHEYNHHFYLLYDLARGYIKPSENNRPPQNQDALINCGVGI